MSKRKSAAPNADFDDDKNDCYFSARPVREVARDAEGGDLHGGLDDEDGREEVVEHLQGVLQLLHK